LNEEAMRAIAGMPTWNPGKQRGQPVKVYFTLPIKFAFR
jgi:protein TonB